MCTLLSLLQDGHRPGGKMSMPTGICRRVLQYHIGANTNELLNMEKTGLEKDEWKIVDWSIVVRETFSYSGMGKFIRNRVPQVFVIWAAIAVFLKLPAFVGVFGWFGRSFNSPFFLVGSIGASQPVDLTPFFLIGFAAILVALFFVSVLYGCIRLCGYLSIGHPSRLEQALVRFSRKMTDEVSSCLTHCSAATAVLLVEGHPERYGSHEFFLCASMAVFAFVCGGMCYRES